MKSSIAPLVNSSAVENKRNKKNKHTHSNTLIKDDIILLYYKKTSLRNQSSFVRTDLSVNISSLVNMVIPILNMVIPILITW